MVEAVVLQAHWRDPPKFAVPFSRQPFAILHHGGSYDNDPSPLGSGVSINLTAWSRGPSTWTPQRTDRLANYASSTNRSALGAGPVQHQHQRNTLLALTFLVHRHRHDAMTSASAEASTTNVATHGARCVRHCRCCIPLLLDTGCLRMPHRWIHALLPSSSRTPPSCTLVVAHECFKLFLGHLHAQLDADISSWFA